MAGATRLALAAELGGKVHQLCKAASAVLLSQLFGLPSIWVDMDQAGRCDRCDRLPRKLG